MDSIFGPDLPTPFRFIIAFAIVLGLIALATWAARRVGGSRLGTPTARGRQPRLAVIDAAAVDSRRRLVLIRRDNVEHLIMIGGPTDVVVEQNIVRAVSVTQAREGAMPRSGSGDDAAQEAAIPSASELAGYDAEPRPSSAQEPALRPSLAEPSPRAVPPRAEPTFRPAPPRMDAPQREPVPREAPRREAPFGREGPPREAPARDVREGLGREPATARSSFESARQSRAPASPGNAPRPQVESFGDTDPDHNLSDMANKLEAALRRSPGPPPPRRHEGPGSSAQRPAEPHSAAAPASDPGAASRAPTQPRPGSDTPQGTPKTVFDSLEEEMASLLGRPNDKP